MGNLFKLIFLITIGMVLGVWYEKGVEVAACKQAFEQGQLAIVSNLPKWDCDVKELRSVVTYTGDWIKEPGTDRVVPDALSQDTRKFIDGHTRIKCIDPPTREQPYMVIHFEIIAKNPESEFFARGYKVGYSEGETEGIKKGKDIGEKQGIRLGYEKFKSAIEKMIFEDNIEREKDNLRLERKKEIDSVFVH